MRHGRGADPHIPMVARTDEPFPEYDVEAEFYDFAWGNITTDLRFYRKEFEGFPKVLDCMCGTGRIAVGLARAGFRVLGIDRSPEMLRRARRRLRGESAVVRRRVRLIRGDLGRTALPPDHDAAVIAVNSYGLIVSRRDRIRALRHIRAALRPRGKLILALDSVRSYREIREGAPFLAAVRPIGRGQIYVRVMAESGGQTSLVRSPTLHLILSRTGSLRRHAVSETVTRVLSPDGVKAELRQAGFRPVRVLGDYDGRRVSAKGGRFIVEARSV